MKISLTVGLLSIDTEGMGKQAMWTSGIKSFQEVGISVQGLSDRRICVFEKSVVTTGDKVTDQLGAHPTRPL